MTIKSAKILVVVSGIFFLITFGYAMSFFADYIGVSTFAAGNVADKKSGFWDIQAIDTVKYSRDIAREKSKDASFDEIIRQQIKNIAGTGATHVAISTPYDDEFLPFLWRWVRVAREYDLKVWFRGNLSGWENWFDYDRISRVEHTAGIERFIINNKDLFEDGDIFSSCPECENGGPGDPRMNGQVREHKDFLISEYNTSKEAFNSIGKKVEANYFPMNGDVAKLIMDVDTTRAFDGLVVVDHYVRTPEQLARDIKDLAAQSKGQVMLGEFGFPIPDIHGDSTSQEQADWLDEAFKKLLSIKNLKGMNYWTSVGGSTELWDYRGFSSPAVYVMEKYYSPDIYTGQVEDEIGWSVAGADIEVGKTRVKTDEKGNYRVLLPQGYRGAATITATNFKQKTQHLEPNSTIVLEKIKPGWLYRMARIFTSRVDKIFN